LTIIAGLKGKKKHLGVVNKKSVLKY